MNNHADEFYREALREINNEGSLVAPRGQETREVIGAHLTLADPHRNIVTLPGRKLNYHFMLAEWLWVMLGLNDVDMIIPYNKALLPFSDDARTFMGAYGPKVIEQMPYIVDVLKKDRNSRQAVLTIWRERPRSSADIPCTVSMQFMIRPDKHNFDRLHMITYMRSNDAWLGLPYDLFTFTMIQQYVASRVSARLGHYHHMVGSLHLYERHFNDASHVRAQGSIMSSLSFNADNIVGEIPSDFRALFMALTLMARHAETFDELKSWVRGYGSLPAPWGDILRVLAHRFHKDDEELPEPWKTLIINARGASGPGTGTVSPDGG